VVKVEHEQRERLPEAPEALHFSRQLLVEGAPVEQPGELVSVGAFLLLLEQPHFHNNRIAHQGTHLHEVIARGGDEADRALEPGAHFALVAHYGQQAFARLLRRHFQPSEAVHGLGVKLVPMLARQPLPKFFGQDATRGRAREQLFQMAGVDCSRSQMHGHWGSPHGLDGKRTIRD